MLDRGLEFDDYFNVSTRSARVEFGGDRRFAYSCVSAVLLIRCGTITSTVLSIHHAILLHSWTFGNDCSRSSFCLCVLCLCHVGILPAGCQCPLWPRHTPLDSLRDDLHQSFLVAYPAPNHPNTDPPSCANRCYACTPSSHVMVLRCWPGVQRSPPKTRRTGGGKAHWLMSIRMTCPSKA